MKISGIEATLEAIKAKSESEIKRKKAAVVDELVKDLRDNTPVDTGHARDSWAVSGDAIVNTADYIGILNQGSSKQAPSNFIEATVLSNKDVKPNGVIVREE